MREGVEGLLRYKSNPPGKTSVPPKRVAEIVRPHAETPPHEVTHWTARAMNECPVPRGAPRSGLAAFYQLQPKTPTPVINPSVSCTGANGDLRSRWVSCHSAASKGAKGRFRHMLTFIMMHSNVAVWSCADLQTMPSGQGNLPEISRLPEPGRHSLLLGINSRSSARLRDHPGQSVEGIKIKPRDFR